MAEEKQYRLPLPVPAPAPSTGALGSSIMAAQTEFEETKIKILGDILNSINSVLPPISSIAKIMKDDFALTKDKIKQEKGKAGEELEAGRETKEPKVSSSLKEAMNEGKGFWTVVTAFFIPAILGFVDAIFDLTSPLGLLGATVTGLIAFFGSRFLLMLLAGSIKLMVAKIGAAIMASIAASKIGTAIRDKVGGLFSDKQTPSSPSSSGKPATAASPAGKPAAPGKAGGAAKFLSGKNLLKGAAGMLAAAGAIFILSKALETFSGLKWETLAMAGTAIVGLGVAAAVLGKFSPIIMLGAKTLGALGIALIPLAGALALTSPFLWALGEALKGLSSVINAVAGGITSVLNGISTVINSVSSGIVSVIETMGNLLKTVSELNPLQITAAAGAITLLGISLVALGATSLVGGLLSLFSGDPIGKLIKLGNVAPNIVELAEVMANFGNIVEFFNDALDNLDGDKAMNQFKLMRDGILMVGEALDDVSMIKLVAFSALSNMSSNKPVISETLESTSRVVAESAEVASGNVPPREVLISDALIEKVNPDLHYRIKEREKEIFEERMKQTAPRTDSTRSKQAQERKAEIYARKQVRKEFAKDLEKVKIPSNIVTNTVMPGDIAGVPSNSTRTLEMGQARSDVRDSSSRATAQSSMVSVNNVNSVNKNETNYKSTSLGTALQGDALRYVY